LAADRFSNFLRHLDGLNGHVPIGQFVYSVHISFKYRYIYVETPKVACTTIKRLLMCAELGQPLSFENAGDIHLREYSPLLNPMQVGGIRHLIRSGFTVFSFVRDPYSRLLSAYLTLIPTNSTEAQAIKLQLGHPLNKTSSISFADFVLAVEAQPISTMNGHWRIQYYQTFHPKLKHSFIGRFERLEEDLQAICRKLGIDFAKYYKPERHHASDAANKLKDYYTDELRAVVARKYKIDFDTFGYAF
jgi:hypothetical protein